MTSHLSRPAGDSDALVVRPAKVLGRRRFLTSLGAGTMAFAVIGLSGCSSDSSGDAGGSSTGSSTGPVATDSDSTQAGGDDGAAVDDNGSEAESGAGNGGGVSWEQVSFGFVSAYLLLRGDEIAVVDTGTEGGAGQIEAGLSALGAGWSNVGHVVLTHSHGDHVGGLSAVLENAPQAAAYAGSADLEAIGNDAVVGLADGDEVFGLQVIGTPGHTPGHIAVFDPASGLLVAGDALNADGGRLTGANPQFTPDMDQANASIRKLAERNVETVLMGHSAPVDNAGALLTELASEL